MFFALYSLILYEKIQNKNKKEHEKVLKKTLNKSLR